MAKSPYDHHWRALRLQVLREEEYRCFVDGCEVRAVTVDHIVPVEEAPHLRLVRSNLRASCAKHNYGRPFARLRRLAAVNRAAGGVRAW